jgi:hypothetical protein
MALHHEPPVANRVKSTKKPCKSGSEGVKWNQRWGKVEDYGVKWFDKNQM